MSETTPIMMINIHIEGAEQPIVLPINKAKVFAKELDKAGKNGEWVKPVNTKKSSKFIFLL